MQGYANPNSPPLQARRPSDTSHSSLSGPGARRPSQPQYNSQQPPFRQPSVDYFNAVSPQSTSPTDSRVTSPNGKSSNSYEFGKLTGWYRGTRYGTDDMWSAVMRKDSSTISKCLKAGLNANSCRWAKDSPSAGGLRIGIGARSIADAVACSGDVKSMRILVEHGVDLSGANSAQFVERTNDRMTMHYFDVKDREIATKDPWTTPLHRACRHNKIEMVRYLVDECHVDPNIRDCQERTGLHLVVLEDSTELATFLLQRGARAEIQDNVNVTPLVGAALWGKLELVKLFIAYGANVNVLAKGGEPPLTFAATEMHFDIVETLIAHGADINQRNHAGRTSFFTAASQLKVDVMDRLIAYGADVDTKDNNGCTALLRATLAKNVVLMQHLLQLGADIGMADNDGWTPLFAAMIHNDDEMIALLLVHGANYEQTDSYGNSGFHQAAILGSTLMVRHLLARKSNTLDLSRPNTFGETPLILASKYNHPAIVKVLLKHGADPHVVDSNGYRAITRAMYWGSHACVQLLVQAGAELDAAAFQALQQGKTDHPGVGHHDLILQRLRPRNQITRKPTMTITSLLQDLFGRSVTRDSLMLRMREKQGKPPTDPEPGVSSPDPQLNAAGAASNKPTTAPSITTITTTTTTAASATGAKPDVKKEPEGEYVSPDPFEACIPPTPATLIINHINEKIGVEATGLAVAMGVANTGIGIASLIMGL